MYRAFDVSIYRDSIVVIIGTMGNVVVVDALLQNKLCKKVLNNLKPSEYINDKIFDKVYYENATTAIEKIEEDIDMYWKPLKENPKKVYDKLYTEHKEIFDKLAKS